MSPEDRLIQRLTTIYGEPRTEDPAAYVEEFAKAVKGYGAEALEEAGTQIIRRSKFWPRPAEIIEQIEAILVAKAAKLRKPKPVVDLPPPTPEARAKAREIAELAKAAIAANKPASADPDELPSMNRDAFEAMQRNSRSNIHVDRQALSRRITGERE